MPIVSSLELDMMTKAMSALQARTNKAGTLSDMTIDLEADSVNTGLDVYTVLATMVKNKAILYCAMLGLYYLHPTRQVNLATIFSTLDT